MSWQCFLIELTGRDRVALRRYAGDSFGKCPGRMSYHNAEAPIGDAPSRGDGLAVEAVDHGDPRWPRKCEACDYVFATTDNWQVFRREIYRAPDGTELVWRDAPVGAMFRVHWYEDTDWKGPDGKSYMVKLPGDHEWAIDGPARDGGRWTRTGEAPKLTVSPSILVPGYHGYLRDGVLTDPV